MKSVLPAELESKRMRIAKTHNRLCFLLLGALFLSLFLLAVLVPRKPNHAAPTLGLLLGCLCIGLLETYAIYRVIQHDYDLCRQLGYTCPFCHKPLYEPRASTWVTGLCPKCGQSV